MQVGHASPTIRAHFERVRVLDISMPKHMRRFLGLSPDAAGPGRFPFPFLSALNINYTRPGPPPDSSESCPAQPFLPALHSGYRSQHCPSPMADPVLAVCLHASRSGAVLSQQTGASVYNSAHPVPVPRQKLSEHPPVGPGNIPATGKATLREKPCDLSFPVSAYPLALLFCEAT